MAEENVLREEDVSAGEQESWNYGFGGHCGSWCAVGG